MSALDRPELAAKCNKAFSLLLTLPCCRRLCLRPADMRKAMPRDVKKQSVVPLTRPVYPHELEHD